MNKGEFAEIEYVGKVKETGEIFDLTDEALAKQHKIFNAKYNYGPLVVVVGAGHVLPGLDEQLEKMKPGEKADLEIAPAKAFGERKAEMVKTYQAAEFRKQRVAPVVGQVVTFYNGVSGKIVSVSSGRVKVDFNHPLAGKALQYELKVNSVVTSTEEKVKALAILYLGSKHGFSTKLSGNKLEITVPEGKKLQDGFKNQVSELIRKHIKEISDVAFIETPAKKPQTAEKSASAGKAE